MVDRDELLAAVDLGELLEELAGIERRGHEFPCPMPTHEQTGRTPPVSLKSDGRGYELWHCHACGVGGTAIDAVMCADGLSAREAIAQLDKRSGQHRRPRSSRQVNRRPPAAPSPAPPGEDELERLRRAMTPDVEARLQALRGWSPEALRSLSVGYDGQRVTFPVRDAAGAVVGALKYQPDPARRADAPKMLASKGAPRAMFPRPEDVPGGVLYVAEGEPDAVTLRSLDLAGVGLPGTGKRDPSWWPRLGRQRDRVVIITDSDDPGRQLAADAARAISPHCRDVRVVDLAPDRSDGYDLTALLLEAREENEDTAADQVRSLLEATAEQTPPWAAAAASAPEKAVKTARRGSGAMLPTTKANDRPLRDVTADALAHIIAANDPPRVFVRGGALTRVLEDERGQPLIDTLDEHATRGLIARTSEFVTRGKQGEQKIAPPKDVVRDLRALGSWPLPALENVTESPVMREDGTVLDVAGYDPPTRLLYRPTAGLRLPPISETPTATERDAALDLLVTEALGDFPFLDDASRAGALALMLTPIVRPLIRGQVPLALLDATKAGTGKGLLAALIAEIATGRPVSLLAAPSREEEWAKTLLSVLKRGATFLLIDEATELASPSLAATLTTPIYEGRDLGRSTIVRLPQRATWAAAGNNIKLGGDIGRRCYWIRLDAQTSRPWRRAGFRHPDLLAWAAAERGRLLGALLTLARSWCVADRPSAPETVTLGGFQAWADVLGGILGHAGTSGFLDNLETLYETADEEASEWEAFLGRWYETHGDAVLTVAALADEITAGGPLRDTLPARLASSLDRPASFRRSLGKALSKREGTRFGDQDLRVERAGEEHHVVLWRVTADGGFGGLGGLLKPDLRARASARAHGTGVTETPRTPKPPDREPSPAAGDET